MQVVERVGRSGWLILGPEVAAFEAALAERWGIPHAVGCGNGLEALELCLKGLGLKPGQKVLTTPLSAFATTLAIVNAGGVPAFIDVDESGLMDLDLAERVLGKRDDIRWVVPVHLYGHALDLKRLKSLQERFGLTVVEDCAQAIGALSHGQPVGSVGQGAAASFYPTKNLGAMGDGGAVLTRSPELAKLVRGLRNYGEAGKYDHAYLGMNSRLDELQAALLATVLLPRLEGWTRRRAELAARYREGLRNPALAVPPVPAASRSVWHLFPVLISGDRKQFQAHLGAAGITTALHYPRLIPDQPALQANGSCERLTPLPRASRFTSAEVSLPVHPYLSDADVDRVVEVCNDWRG